jgi:hypothetical protein
MSQARIFGSTGDCPSAILPLIVPVERCAMAVSYVPPTMSARNMTESIECFMMVAPEFIRLGIGCSGRVHDITIAAISHQLTSR